MPELPARKAASYCFVHPVFDALFVAGGLTFPALFLSRATLQRIPFEALLLLFNHVHFAGSVVRLYTKPGPPGQHRVLKGMLTPLAFLFVTFAVTRLAGYSDAIFRLYASVSPFHYSAQAFGIALLYAGRAGFQLTAGERRLLWWSAFLPFLSAFFLRAYRGIGLGLFLPPGWLAQVPPLQHGVILVGACLGALAFVVPLVFWRKVWRWRAGARPPPMILVLLLSNALWWTYFSFTQSLTVVTVFHALQYLTVVLSTHVAEQSALDGAIGRRRVWHAVAFYAMSFPLGWFLFVGWPWLYDWAGYDATASASIVISVVNLHHFAIDAFLWRRSRQRLKSCKGAASIAVRFDAFAKN